MHGQVNLLGYQFIFFNADYPVFFLLVKAMWYSPDYPKTLQLTLNWCINRDYKCKTIIVQVAKYSRTKAILQDTHFIASEL